MRPADLLDTLCYFTEARLSAEPKVLSDGARIATDGAQVPSSFSII